MSTFRQAAYDRVSGTVRTAWWLDDYFGRHRFGVQFDKDGPVYQPAQVDIPLDVVFAPVTEDGK